MDKLQAFKEITCSMMKENIALLKAWKKDVLYDTGDFTRIYNWIQELGKVPKKKSNIEGKYDDAMLDDQSDETIETLHKLLVSKNNFIL